MAKKQPLKSEIVPKEQASPALKSAAMSVYDTAMALELGELDPSSLQDPAVVVECALIYRSKRYPLSQIAAILKVTSRTVSRYVAQARKDNAIKPDPHFQAEFVGDSLNNLWAQYSRLIRWSYSDELSETNKIRSALSAFQVHKYIIEFIERLGYLNQNNTEFSIKSELARKYGEEAEGFWGLDVDSLNSDQLKLVMDAKLQKDEEVDKSMKQFVAKLTNKDESNPFEFSVEDINFDSFRNSLHFKRSYDRCILEMLGIKYHKNPEQCMVDLTPELLVAAMNDLLHVPSFSMQAGIGIVNSDSSIGPNTIAAQDAVLSSLKKHKLMNLNATILAGVYPDEILDVYRDRLPLWEKQLDEQLS